MVHSAGIANELSSQCSEEQLKVLRGPVVPEPMFFCTIEPPSAAYQAGIVNDVGVVLMGHAYVCTVLLCCVYYYKPLYGHKNDLMNNLLKDCYTN